MSRRAPEPDRERGKWPVGLSVSFFVGGIEPVPKGSMKAFVPKSWANKAVAAGKAPKAVITDQKDGKLRAYESNVRNACRAELDKRMLPMAHNQPFEVVLGFFFSRNPGEFDKVGRVLPGARSAPWVMPDIDKATRSTLDAMTRIAWDNDSRIVRLVAEKRFSNAQTDIGVWVTLKVLPATVDELFKFSQRVLNTK